jgi:hypothetical protein
MNELDLLRAASPIAADRAAALDLRAAELDLLDEIMSTHPRRRVALRWRPLALATAVAAAAAVVIALIPGGTSRPEYAAAAVRVAEANARILVGEPGWTITEAEQFTVDEGEVTFTNGDRRFEVHWYPADQYRGYLRDRAADAEQRTITVLGRPARRFTYRALRIQDVATILPPQGSNFAEIRGGNMSLGRFMRVLRSAKTVDVNTWLAAMPVALVRPHDRPAIVDQMLKGVPIPPGVDVAKLREGGVHSTYQLVIEVYKPIACGWLERGDKTALRNARRWPGFALLADEQRAPAATAVLRCR